MVGSALVNAYYTIKKTDVESGNNCRLAQYGALYLFSLGTTWATYVVSAVNHVINKKHLVRVSNHSYGGFPITAAEETAMKRLSDAGILAVVAAGNDGEEGGFYYGAAAIRAPSILC